MLLVKIQTIPLLSIRYRWIVRNAKIEKNIAFEKGVKALSVDLDAKTVKVTYTKAKNDVAKLQKAIEKLGYEVAVKNEVSN